MTGWRFPKAVTLALDIGDGGRLVLPDYPFPARHTRVVVAADIREVVDWYPPALRLRNGEFLFVDREDLDRLKAWCAGRGVPVVNRYDVWADLLEPFLDTGFDAEDTARTMARLAQHGFDGGEVAALRAEVAGPMDLLTVFTWEWTHYGMYDVLVATMPVLSFVGRTRRRAFVRQTMMVADRGCAASS